MRRYFETKIKYYDKEADKQVSKVYLVEAFGFTEGEANVTTYFNDLHKENKTAFEITAMRKVWYTDLIYDKEVEGEWFEVNVEVDFGDDSKPMKEKYLVASGDVQEATNKVIKYSEENGGNETNIQALKYKAIEDIVIKKQCGLNGTVIVGLSQQLEINEHIENGEVF